MTDLSALARPGDLLFYRVTPSSSLIARLIASAELLRGEGEGATQYSHVAILCYDKTQRIEAKWPRVRRSLVDWSDPEIEVWRRKLNDDQLDLMLLSAMSRIGNWYDLGQFFFGLFRSRNAEICTTLVRDSFADAGIHLGEGAGRLLTPNELACDPSLFRIG